jgi:hypothetical protein
LDTGIPPPFIQYGTTCSSFDDLAKAWLEPWQKKFNNNYY